MAGWELTCHLLSLDDGVAVVNDAVAEDGVDAVDAAVVVAGDRMCWLVDWFGSDDVVAETWGLFGLGLEWGHLRDVMVLLERRGASCGLVVVVAVESSYVIHAVVVVVGLLLVVEDAGQVELVQFVLVDVDT